MAKRFRVTFENIQGKRFAYYVCTCFDDRKAIVIASAHHGDMHPGVGDRIYAVVEAAVVDGDQPYESDLCDRAEW